MIRTDSDSIESSSFQLQYYNVVSRLHTIVGGKRYQQVCYLTPCRKEAGRVAQMLAFRRDETIHLPASEAKWMFGSEEDQISYKPMMGSNV